jgi:hypothetical protein
VQIKDFHVVGSMPCFLRPLDKILTQTLHCRLSTLDTISNTPVRLEAPVDGLEEFIASLGPSEAARKLKRHVTECVILTEGGRILLAEQTV